jgi:hypothetical protein
MYNCWGVPGMSRVELMQQVPAAQNQTTFHFNQEA